MFTLAKQWSDCVIFTTKTYFARGGTMFRRAKTMFRTMFRRAKQCSDEQNNVQTGGESIQDLWCWQVFTGKSWIYLEIPNWSVRYISILTHHAFDMHMWHMPGVPMQQITCVQVEINRWAFALVPCAVPLSVAKTLRARTSPMSGSY